MLLVFPSCQPLHVPKAAFWVCSVTMSSRLLSLSYYFQTGLPRCCVGFLRSDGGIRTHTPIQARDFKSLVSTVPPHRHIERRHHCWLLSSVTLLSQEALLSTITQRYYKFFKLPNLFLPFFCSPTWNRTMSTCM
jgi:hypothetical protein